MQHRVVDSSALHKEAIVKSISLGLWHDIALALLKILYRRCLLKSTQSTSHQLGHFQTTALWVFSHIWFKSNLWSDATSFELSTLQSMICAANVGDTAMKFMQDVCPLTLKIWAGIHNFSPLTILPSSKYPQSTLLPCLILPLPVPIWLSVHCTSYTLI